MTAQTRAYSTADYGTARFVYENRLLDGSPDSHRAAISEIGLSLTIARVQRLKRLNLIDGDELTTADGDLVKLTGLGVKTAKEAIRLGIASV